jgi:hypothetical protein
MNAAVIASYFFKAGIFPRVYPMSSRVSPVYADPPRGRSLQHLGGRGLPGASR